MSMRFARIPARRLGKYRRNAREYDDPGKPGKRLNASAIVTRFRVNWSTFYRSCAPTLVAIPMRFNRWTRKPDDASEDTEDTWLERDVREALKLPDPSGGRIVLDGVEHFTFARTMRELRLNRAALTKLSKDFPFSDPNPLVPRSGVPLPGTGMPGWVFSAEGVRLAKAKLSEVRGGRVTLPDGRVFLSATRAHLEWRDGRRAVPVLRSWHWRHVGCRHLGGDKLTALSLPTPGLGFAPGPWFLEGEVVGIKRALLKERAAATKGKVAKSVKEICEAAGLPGSFNRAAVGVFLADTFPEPHGYREVRGRNARLYDPKAVARALAGRELGVTARAHYRAGLRFSTRGAQPPPPAPQGDQTAPAAESRTNGARPREPLSPPLQQHRHPVEAYQPEGHVFRVVVVPTEPEGKPARPRVILGERADSVIVNGVPKPPLETTAYRVIRALVDVWPGTIGLSNLAEESEYSEPHKILGRLEEDADWKAVIKRPGRGNRGGYGVR